MVSASLCVGLTLPGMIEDPGSFSGSLSSPSPQRGTEPSRRISFGILKRPVRQGREPRREQFGKARMRIETGADRSAALGDREKVPHRLADACDCGFDL